MTRVSFIQNLLAAGGLSIVGFRPGKQYQKIYLLQTFVAGFQHYGGPQMLAALGAGTTLHLVREPDNAYDDSAIALHCKGVKIGFVPADDNVTLSRLLDASLLELHAEITHLEPRAADWEKVHLAIFALREVKDLPPYADHLITLHTPEYRSLRRQSKINGTFAQP